MHERRKHPRKRSNARIIYIIKTPFYELSLTSKLRDISQGGIRFISRRFLRPGSTFDAFLQIPRCARDIFAQCRIVWSKWPWWFSRSGHEAGASFVHMAEDDRHLLHTHLAELPEDKKT